jgi:hypothetical protein
VKKKPYLPKDDAGKVVWLNNFREKLPLYAAALGITPIQLAQLDTDADAFSNIFLFQNGLKDTMEAYTGFKNLLRNGTGTLPAVPPIPSAPMLPPNAQSNVFGSVAQLVQNIKSNPAYDPNTMGDDLRIIGDEQTIDPNSWKPIIKAENIAGSPNIKWTKGDADALKIKVNRGTGYELLAIDTKPDYLDKHTLPPFGQSALWKYSAIYILDDEEVGQWSDELEVAVKGVA